MAESMFILTNLEKKKKRRLKFSQGSVTGSAQPKMNQEQYHE